MAVHFHHLSVKDIYRETPDCVVISFEIPELLKDVFQYTHGQNLTLKKNIGGEELRRSYSVCSAPHENRLSIAVKKLASGKFSTYINTHLKKGDLLEVLPPTGRFTVPFNKTNHKKYLAIAAGSGITPILSIIKSALVTEPASCCTLVYGNRSRASIIFFEELAALKNKYPGRFHFINVLSRERTEVSINSGRIDLEKLIALQKLVDYKSMDEVFICGPREMLFVTKQFLENSGIAQHKIHIELFTAKNGDSSTGKQLPGSTDTGPKSKITVRLDGRSFSFDLAFNSESILDAALKQGADLPYACKGGVCSTCRAILTEGKVKMDINYALETDEVAKGCILTCQSHPLTPVVGIDFDSR